jgi:hypothetical protein
MTAISLPARPPLTVAPDVTRKVIADQAEQLERAFAARPWTAARADGAQQLALDTAYMRAAIDPSDPAIVRDLERAACASAALFGAVAAGHGGRVEISLPGGDLIVVEGIAADRGDPIDWRTGLLAALASRNQAALKVLAGIPLEVLLRLAPSDPTWQQREREALMAFAVGRAGAGDLLVTAAREADPATVDPRIRDWVLDIVTPELQLAFSVLAHDASGLDRWMAEAIKGHHHYYVARAEPRKTVAAQLALAPLAIACVARDRGIPTTVTSDYVPAAIIG